MKKERFFALLTVICIMVSTVMTVPFSVSAEGEDPNICVIAKFDNEEMIQTAVARNPVRLSSGGLEETWNGKTALKMTSGTGEALILSCPNPDWSQYKWFRMRFYANRAGMQFNIIPTTYDKGNIDENPYFRTSWTVAAEGWQEIAIPIKKDSTFGFNSFSKPVAGVNTPPNWNQIQGMYLNTNGWDVKSQPSDILYFDEIWLEKEKTFQVSGSGEAVDGKILFDTNSDTAIDQTPCKQDFLSIAGAREGGSTGYAAMKVLASSKGTDWIFYEDKAHPIDLTAGENRYLNMWIYSPAAVNGGLHVVCTDSNGKYGLNPIRALDWKGWKLITLDMSSFKTTSSGEPKFDPTKVVSVKFNVQGWQADGFGLHAGIWKKDGFVGLEKAWLSAAPAVDPNEPVLPQGGEKVSLPEGNLLLKDFCSADDETLHSAPWEGKPEYWQADGGNGRVYDMNARISWDKKKAQTKYLFYTTEAAKKISLDQYNYWNLWIYSPGVKTDSNGKPSTLIFNINTGNSADAVDKKNHPYFLPVDWEGWKLVSLSLDAILGGDKAFGMHQVAIAVNEWTGSSANVLWYDTGNFIDVERSWLSEGEPAKAYTIAENGLSVADGAEDVPCDLDSYSISMNTENDARVLAGKVKVFAGTQPLTEEDYTVSSAGKKITISFRKKLQPETKYTVRLDGKLADVYGNQLKNAKTYSFTTEKGSYIVEKFALGEDGKSVLAEITVLDENTYPFTLILAVEQNGALMSAEIGETRTLSKADGKQTLMLSMKEIPEGGKLRAMLWDDTESMKPYAEAVLAN